MELGKRLRAARETRGQRMADVASALRCHVNTVWRWECGLSVPRGYYLRQLQAAYPELAE